MFLILIKITEEQINIRKKITSISTWFSKEFGAQNLRRGCVWKNSIQMESSLNES